MCAIMKKISYWMLIVRHKRSQKAGVVYALLGEVASVDALTRISSLTIECPESPDQEALLACAVYLDHPWRSPTIQLSCSFFPVFGRPWQPVKLLETLEM